jgi:UPF0271 protein
MIAQKKIPILIFDTNIFLKGIDFNLFEERIFTTPKIVEEIEVLKYSNKNRNILNRVEVAISNGHLVVRNPKRNYIIATKARANVTGDIDALSEADIGLIALALELTEILEEDIVLYSNDYSIQNLCSEMDIKYSPIFKKGIKNQKTFEVYCPSCKKTYNSGTKYQNCEVCGSKLKMRPKTSKKNIV